MQPRPLSDLECRHGLLLAPVVALAAPQQPVLPHVRRPAVLQQAKEGDAEGRDEGGVCSLGGVLAAHMSGQVSRYVPGTNLADVGQRILQADARTVVLGLSGGRMVGHAALELGGRAATEAEHHDAGSGAQHLVNLWHGRQGRRGRVTGHPIDRDRHDHIVAIRGEHWRKETGPTLVYLYRRRSVTHSPFIETSTSLGASSGQRRKREPTVLGVGSVKFEKTICRGSARDFSDLPTHGFQLSAAPTRTRSLLFPTVMPSGVPGSR